MKTIMKKFEKATSFNSEIILFYIKLFYFLK